jgi:queuine tRNA-ribosyltransferase
MTAFSFTITATDGSARAGTLETPHGSLQTPVFMPVGTAGTIK